MKVYWLTLLILLGIAVIGIVLIALRAKAWQNLADESCKAKKK